MNRESVLRVFALCLLVLFSALQEARAYDDTRKYGIELRGGFSLYQVSDTRDVLDHYQSSTAAKITESYSGPSGGFSLLWRQEKYFQWNIGCNFLLDFESEAKWNDTTLTLSGRATEIFALGNLVFPVLKGVRFYAGGGLTYLVARQDILWQPGNSIFDGTGRTFGAIANSAIEIFVGHRLGVAIGGGYRIANVTKMTDTDFSGTRTRVRHPLANRAWEADFSGPYMVTGLRIYFDPVTKPINLGE